jgi:hypothetical protein
MSSDVLTVFVVPRLALASVVAGACCPVPAEALILPELELVPGVHEASSDWSSATVRVRHSPDVAATRLAQVLEELEYPPQSWNSESAQAVTDQ